MGDSFAESGPVRRNVDDEEEEQSKKIRIRVKWNKDDDLDDQGKGKKKEVEDVYFNVDNDIPLRWLMIRYCDTVGANFDRTRFEFKGACLRETDTPLHLSMLPSELICAYTFHFVRSSVNHATVCIRMHREKDTFLRVRRTAPLRPQLIRGLSDVGLLEEGSVCFVFTGTRLNDDSTADGLDMEDGDIIDAFNFDESSSSLSIIKSRIALKVINDETSKHHMFQLKRSTHLSVLMNKYRKVEGLNENAAFFHGERRLMGSKTAEEEKLEDGDEIVAISVDYSL